MQEFDINETTLNELITIFNKYNIKHSIGYIFDDDTDEEIGYRLFIHETFLDVAYGKHDIIKKED